ncbi:MAG: hypothetical protein CMH55_01950 [Myxococcales bacterium]|nr:hypothetical protein [Myxococcales bacterium]
MHSRIVCSALLALLACSHETPDSGPDGGGIPPIEIGFLQAQDGAFRANPTINGILPIRLESAEAEVIEVSLGDQTKPAQRLDDGSWIVEISIEALADGVHEIEARAQAGAAKGDGAVRLFIDRQGHRLTDWEAVGTADSPQFHHHHGQLYLTWTDRRAEPRGGYLQAIDGSGAPLAQAISITPADQAVARVHGALGEGLLGLIHQQLVADGRRHWISVLDLDGNVLLEPIPLESDRERGRFQHVIAYDGEAWVAAWRLVTADDAEVIRWVRFSEGGILAGPHEIARAGSNDPHGDFLPYIQMRIAARQGHSVVSFTRDYWDDVLDMGISRNQVVVIDPAGELLEAGILPHSLLMPFEHESHVHRIGDDLVTLSTASSLADEALHEPHRIFASRVPTEFPASPEEWDYRLVLDAPRTRGEMMLVAHEREWAVMAWTDERGRDQPGSPEDKIQLLVAPLSDPDSGFRIGGHVAVPHVRLFSGMAKLSGQSLGSQVLLVWVDERNGTAQQSRPELFMDAIWY